jgi:DNA (cytosine-5)-methyltransferase 1
MLSLYSGIGGIDLAAHWAGIETLAFCESDQFCCSILSRHWPGVPCFESDELVSADRWNLGPVDIIAGGPPCQPFSVAGKREGVADPRHRWPQMARIVAELRPAWVVVENVAGFGDVAERLVRPDLEGLGYETIRFDIPAAAIGAPHERQRIFVVAYPDGARREEPRSRSKFTQTESERARATVGRSGCVADSSRNGGRVESTETGTERERTRVRAESSVGYSTREQRKRDRGAWGRRGEPSDASKRLTESLMGRIAARISDRLDSALWPAARGQQQHDWEPPRVTTDREHRRKRLKALGNACVPYQVYPIFAAIVAMSR